MKRLLMTVGLLAIFAGGCASPVVHPTQSAISADVVADPAVAGNHPRQRVHLYDLISKIDLIGRTGEPIFKLLHIEGEVIDRNRKGWDGGRAIRVRRINGRATQAVIEIPVDDAPFNGPEPKDLEELIEGRFYSMDGYESGDFVGTPVGVYEQAGVRVNSQTSDVHLTSRLNIFRATSIPPVTDSPAMFVGQEAMFEGTAESSGQSSIIKGTAWRILVKSDAAWPDWMEGKLACVKGTIRQTNDPTQFTVERPSAGLVRLEDMVGRDTELRCIAWSRNDDWHLDYRGTEVDVEGLQKLRGWTANQHGAPVIIWGRLERQTIIDETNRKFVIKKPEWKPLSELLLPEMSKDNWRYAQLSPSNPSAMSHCFAPSASEQIRNTSWTVPVPE